MADNMSLSEFGDDFLGAVNSNEADQTGADVRTHNKTGFLVGDDSQNYIDDDGDLTTLGEYTMTYPDAESAQTAIDDYAENYPDHDALRMFSVGLIFTVNPTVPASVTGADVLDDAYAGIATRD
jgi:hypothetical protein